LRNYHLSSLLKALIYLFRIKILYVNIPEIQILEADYIRGTHERQASMLSYGISGARSSRRPIRSGLVTGCGKTKLKHNYSYIP
jgi:hypothetical protein